MDTVPDAAAAVRDDVTFERIWLDERSWVDVARGWLRGADDIYAALVERAAWRQARLWRYERWVDEPRLVAPCPLGEAMPHPAIVDAHRELRSRYGVSFERPGLAWYRDGRDSVAFHRDRDLRWLDDTAIAIVSLGATRSWFLRPRENRFAHEAPNRGATHDLAPGSGDLVVMGGRCQVAWEHSVPKVPNSVEGRVSVQWRWTSRTGPPVYGPSYRAARNFSRRSGRP